MGHHNSSLYFTDGIPPVAKFDASTSTLNSLSKLGVANTGLVVNIKCCLLLFSLFPPLILPY